MQKYIETLNGDLQPSKRGNYYRVVDVDRYVKDLQALTIPLVSHVDEVTTLKDKILALQCCVYVLGTLALLLSIKVAAL